MAYYWCHLHKAVHTEPTDTCLITGPFPDEINAIYFGERFDGAKLLDRHYLNRYDQHHCVRREKWNSDVSKLQRTRPFKCSMLLLLWWAACENTTQLWAYRLP
jgi:hypothetical protein